MPVFQYEGTDGLGSPVQGYVTGQDATVVGQRLVGLLGTQPEHLVEVSGKTPAMASNSLPVAGPRPAPTPRPLKKDDYVRAYVTRNFNATFGGVFIAFPLLAIIPILASGNIFPLLFVVPFGAVGWWIAKKGIIEAQEDIWLVQNGATTVGTVTKVGFGNSSKNGQKSFLLHYDYDTAFGTEKGSLETFNRQITRLEVGSQTWVLFHPDRRDISMIWPPIWRLEHKK